MTSKSWWAVIISLSVMMAAPFISFGQQVYYQGSAQFATGKYLFSESTDSFYLLNGLSLSDPDYNLSFSVPLISQNSPWISYSAIGVTPTGGKQNGEVNNKKGGGGGKGGNGSGMMSITSTGTSGGNAVVSEEIALEDTVSYTKTGFGDPTISGGITLLPQETGQPGIKLNGSVKIPLADFENGYGTGEWDFGAGLSVSTRLSDWFLMADAMYWWLGDLPELDLKNPVSYSLGIGYPLVYQKVALMASYYGYTRIIAGVEPPRTAGLSMSYWFSGGHSLSLSGNVGLSDVSPDYSLSLGWSIKL